MNFEPLISRSVPWRLSYPGSIDDTGLNFSLESNAMQGVVVFDIIIWPQRNHSVAFKREI